MTLRDALAEVETDMRAARKIFGDIPSDMDDWAIVAAAARRVAQAPQWLQQLLENPTPARGIAYCDTHKAEGWEYCWRAAYVIPDSDDAKARCRMVRKLLVDPAEET